MASNLKYGHTGADSSVPNRRSARVSSTLASKNSVVSNLHSTKASAILASKNSSAPNRRSAGASAALSVKNPNATTLAAFAEIESGKCKAFDSVEALMADLNADD